MKKILNLIILDSVVVILIIIIININLPERDYTFLIMEDKLGMLV